MSEPRDTDIDGLHDRDTLPPPSLTEQLQRVEALIGELVNTLLELSRTIKRHEIAILIVEQRARELEGLPARVLRLEQKLGLAAE